MNASPNIDQLCRAAIDQADGFAGGPVKAWVAPPSPVRRRVTLVVSACVAGAALGLALTELWPESSHPGAQEPRSLAMEPRRSPTPASAVALRPTVAATSRAATLPAVAARVQVDDGSVSIDLRAVTLDEAVSLLARATGARVHGLDRLNGGDVRISLQWRGRDLLQAWRAVLGTRVGHAASCGSGRCEVWLLGPSVSSTDTLIHPPAPAQPALSMPADTRPQAPSQKQEETDSHGGD